MGGGGGAVGGGGGGGGGEGGGVGSHVMGKHLQVSAMIQFMHCMCI